MKAITRLSVVLPDPAPVRPMTNATLPPRSADAIPEFALKVGFARMLSGGVILDVTTADEARIAEEAGAVAVMALERVPADIRREGGVARMASIDRIAAIQEAVSIPVLAKVRIGHTAEARVLEALGVDLIDESEVLTPADAEVHVEKHGFRIPFVCGCRDLGEALRRVGEGAALLRTKGEAGTGDVVEAVRHLRRIGAQIRTVVAAPAEEIPSLAKELGAPLELVRRLREEGRLPVPSFAAGGVATPADAALVMSLGAEAVFVGSGVFHSSDPRRTAAAIVKATAGWRDAGIVLEACRASGAPMRGTAAAALASGERLQERGW